MGFILPWSLFWRWGSVPPFNLVVNKKASGLFRSLAYGIQGILFVFYGKLFCHLQQMFKDLLFFRLLEQFYLNT